MKKKLYETRTLTAIRTRIKDHIEHYWVPTWECDADKQLLDGMTEILKHERLETQKAILMLIEGMSQQQVAERLKISRQAVGKKVERLRPTLGELLKTVAKDRGFTGEFAPRGNPLERPDSSNDGDRRDYY